MYKMDCLFRIKRNSIKGLGLKDEYAGIFVKIGLYSSYFSHPYCYYTIFNEAEGACYSRLAFIKTAFENKNPIFSDFSERVGWLLLFCVVSISCRSLLHREAYRTP